MATSQLEVQNFPLSKTGEYFMVFYDSLRVQWSVWPYFTMIAGLGCLSKVDDLSTVITDDSKRRKFLELSKCLENKAMATTWVFEGFKFETRTSKSRKKWVRKHELSSWKPVRRQTCKRRESRRRSKTSGQKTRPEERRTEESNNEWLHEKLLIFQFWLFFIAVIFIYLIPVEAGYMAS